MYQIRRGIGFLLLMGMLVLAGVPGYGQGNTGYGNFPEEGFVQVEPTVPNEQLNFSDDTNPSCCLRDYQKNRVPSALESTLPSFNPQAGNSQGGSTQSSSGIRPLPANPNDLQDCSKYAEIPELATNEEDVPDFKSRMANNPRSLFSYTTNVSTKKYEGFFINHPTRVTTNFHIASEGGYSMAQLEDVAQYSVCMARGGNVVAVANTDNGSIQTFNGNDHVYLSGNNTNMLTRTGSGEDIIEIHQAQPVSAGGESGGFRGESWSSYTIYRTALSGSAGTDTLVIQDTPAGTKWCHIGGYSIFGEYFYVVEFALPPSVVQGPRRQRVNIGRSVEYVVFRGQKYALREFLSHGVPVDAVARSIPLDAPLDGR